MEVILHFEDRDWTLDLDEIDLAQARTIQRNTGLSLVEFTRGALFEGNPEALAWAYWLMHKQNDERAEDPNRVNFKVSKFATELLRAHEEKAREIEAANPKDEASETPSNPAK